MMSTTSKQILPNGYTRWSAEEDAILREYYPVEGTRVVKRLPGRTKAACMWRVRKLGLYFTGDFRKIRSRSRKPVKRKDAWTKEEEDVLRRYYFTEGTKVYLRLNSRTRDACKARAEKLGLKTVVTWGKPKKAKGE